MSLCNYLFILSLSFLSGVMPTEKNDLTLSNPESEIEAFINSENLEEGEELKDISIHNVFFTDADIEAIGGADKLELLSKEDVLHYEAKNAHLYKPQGCIGIWRTVSVGCGACFREWGLYKRNCSKFQEKQCYKGGRNTRFVYFQKVGVFGCP